MNLSTEEIERVLKNKKAPCNICVIRDTCTYSKYCDKYQLWRKEVYLKK